MRHTEGRNHTALRTSTPARPGMHKPQPITQEEARAALERMTPEECRRVMDIAIRRKWARYSDRVLTSGVFKGGNAETVNDNVAKAESLREL